MSKNKRISLIALGLLTLGVSASLAAQSFAQKTVVPGVPLVANSASIDQPVDQKNQQDSDTETPDDESTPSQDGREQGENVDDADGGANED